MDEGRFATDNESARRRFRNAADQAGALREQLRLSASGPGQQQLTIDIARLVAPAPENICVHLSGVHGVEGFCGSAIQLELLRRPPPMRSKDALILVHGVNPYGMAWARRVNENNVDLNRNFLAAEEPYAGVSEGYVRQEELLNPRSSSGFIDTFYPRILGYIFRLGFAKWKESVACGQYQYPKGLFYGGQKLEQGPCSLLDWMMSTLRSAARVVAIDVHSGLGQYAQESLIVTHSRESHQFAMLEQRLGGRLISLDPREAAYHARGMLTQAIERQRGGAETWAIGEEFGTLSVLRVLKALRDENCRFHSGDSERLDPHSRHRLVSVFCPSSIAWQRRVLQQGYQLVTNAAAIAFRAAREP